MHRRFWVFYGPTYYPEGGMKDDRHEFITADEAIAWARGYMRIAPDSTEPQAGLCQWAHVWDSVDDKLIFEARG